MSNKNAVASPVETRILSNSSVLRITRDNTGKLEEAFIQTPYVARGIPQEDIEMARTLLGMGGNQPIPTGL